MEKKIVYSNSVAMSASPYDITINFMLMQQEGSMEEECRVFLSPQHAKAVLNALNQTINTYEELFGEITPAITPEKMQELQEKGILQQPGAI